MPAGANERFVLDSYALLAYFQDEEGADKVQTVLEMGLEDEILARIDEMPIEMLTSTERWPLKLLT